MTELSQTVAYLHTHRAVLKKDDRAFLELMERQMKEGPLDAEQGKRLNELAWDVLQGEAW